MRLEESSEPIFILGSGRSGTSILAWSLAQHPGLCTSSESDFIYYLFGHDRLRSVYQNAYERPDRPWLAQNQISYEEFASHIGLGIDLLFQTRSEGKRWIDSTPTYTMMAHDLALMFPSAQFLHIIRDGRAVVNSMINSGFADRFATDFKFACEMWVDYVKRGRSFQQSHMDRTMEVRLERLVEDPIIQFSRVLEFLNVETDNAPADFFRTNRINSSYGNTSLADMRNPKTESVIPKSPWDNWSEKRKLLFREIAGPTMSELGYSD